MNRRNTTRLLATALAVVTIPSVALAADHTDSPAAEDDPAADISDFYAWHTQDDRLVLVLNYAGLTAAGGQATYDADMLYGFHIDRDGDNVSDHDIWVRFGQNDADEWGVQIEGLPGDDTVSGAVDTNMTTTGGNMVFAGPREDPFFFDFEGFMDTLSTMTLAFDPTRDSFATTNVTSIVVDVDLDMAASGSDALSIWATAARKG